MIFVPIFITVMIGMTILYVAVSASTLSSLHNKKELHMELPKEFTALKYRKKVLEL